MGRIGSKLNSDGVTGRASEDASLTKVIFHIARALDRFGIGVAFELCKELLVFLADDVDENVEPTAVSHSQDRRLHRRVCRRRQQRVEEWDG